MEESRKLQQQQKEEYEVNMFTLAYVNMKLIEVNHDFSMYSGFAIKAGNREAASADEQGIKSNLSS
jgi:hypothetical protein